MKPRHSNFKNLRIKLSDAVGGRLGKSNIKKQDFGHWFNADYLRKYLIFSPIKNKA